MADSDAGVDHDLVVAQFQAFTGLEDVEGCRHILEAHGWNVEMAVQDTFNEQEGQAPVYGHMSTSGQEEQHPSPLETSGESSPSPIVGDFVDGNAGMAEQGLRHRIQAAPAPSSNGRSKSSTESAPYRLRRAGVVQTASAPGAVVQRTWWQWCYEVASFPFRTIGNSAWFIARFLFGVLTGTGHGMLMNVTDPEGDVERFIESFNAKFGDADGGLPAFLKCSYAAAVQQSKRDLKLLLVYVHNENDRDLDEMCRSVVCSPHVVDFVNSNMLVFGVSSASPEGRRVASTLRTWGRPMLCIITHRDGMTMCIDRIPLMSGMVSAEMLVTRLQQIYGIHHAQIAGERQNRQRIEQDRLIREQQEMEFKESLRRDQERDNALHQQEEAKRARATERQRRKDERQERADELLARRLSIASCLPTEPESSADGVVRLSFRLPDNSRLTRSFRSEEPLSLVSDFVFSHENAPAKFTLQTSYPRRDLPTGEGSTLTVAEANLGPAAVLIVKSEVTYESDSEEDETSDEEE